MTNYFCSVFLFFDVANIFDSYLKSSRSLVIDPFFQNDTRNNIIIGSFRGMIRPSSSSNERRNASSSSRSSSSILLIPDAFLEGLALEVSILDALLQRHRCSHGRTIYFKRMQMALKPLLRHELESTTTIGGKTTTTNLTKYLVLVDAVHRLRDLLEKKNMKQGKNNKGKEKSWQENIQNARVTDRTNEKKERKA